MFYVKYTYVTGVAKLALNQFSFKNKVLFFGSAFKPALPFCAETQTCQRTCALEVRHETTPQTISERQLTGQSVLWDMILYNHALS
jgi:hypothetical protein